MSTPSILKRVVLQFPPLRRMWEASQLWNHWSRFVPPGHFYSPMPSDADVGRWCKARVSAETASGLNLNGDMQQALVAKLAENYKEIPFKNEAVGGQRYHYNNSYFCHSDAIFLHLILRHVKPRSVIEVGSGYSSAVMLDTVEQFLGSNCKLTFIEPYPERLRGLLRPDDMKHCTIIEKPVQEVGVKPFLALDSGDILFIDSSHVSKAGSDVNFMLFEVLPRLKSGVWIHIHDVFPDFDYPEEWLRQGRAWNEAYILRAFLLFNDAFEVVLHVPFQVGERRDWFQKHMPDCLINHGGSLWMRRK